MHLVIRSLRPTGRGSFRTALCALSVLWAGHAVAQEEATDEEVPAREASEEPTPAPEEVPAPEEAAAPEPEPAPAAPEPPVLEAAPAEAPPEEPAAPEEKPFEPSFTVGVGMRTGLAMTFNAPGAMPGEEEVQFSLDDGLVDQANIRPFMAGSLTPNLGFFTQFEIGTANGLGNFAILDAIAQVKIVDEFQIWAGQHIPANDRNNMNGPFFGNTWNFAVAVAGYPFDAGARDRGFTIWGLIADGVLKYHLSMVDLQPGNPIEQSRFAGRLTLHLLEPENFYYNSGTYFGTQDILTVGAVIHGQQGDEGADNDLLGFSVDAMFEKNFDSAGTITAELGYWNFEETGAGYAVNQNSVDVGIGVGAPPPGQSFMAVLSWLTPNKIGIGQIQPNARFQYGNFGVEQTVLDLGLAYVVDGFNHKYHLNYRHSDTGGAGEDMLQVGFQYLMAK